jgi:hypothetical protein
MKRRLIGGAVVALALGLAAGAWAYGPGFYRAGGGWGWGGQMGPGMMGGGWGMGPGMMGGGSRMGPGTAGPEGAPCWQGGPTGTTATQITDEKAKEIATSYTTKYLPGFTVERVLPFSGMHTNLTMYQVELQGPKGETRTLHINPFGQVMPFGPSGPRASAP